VNGNICSWINNTSKKLAAFCPIDFGGLGWTLAHAGVATGEKDLRDVCSEQVILPSEPSPYRAASPFKVPCQSGSMQQTFSLRS
jgi:hypothetical protein